jgi:hypothetical protein
MEKAEKNIKGAREEMPSLVTSEPAVVSKWKLTHTEAGAVN